MLKKYGTLWVLLLIKHSILLAVGRAKEPNAGQRTNSSCSLFLMRTEARTSRFLFISCPSLLSSWEMSLQNKFQSLELALECHNFIIKVISVTKNWKTGKLFILNLSLCVSAGCDNHPCVNVCMYMCVGGWVWNVPSVPGLPITVTKNSLM